MNLEREVLGKTIRAEALHLDEGWDVSVFGGSRSHVGAVTLAEADGSAQTLVRANHRDDVLSLRWAQALAQRWGESVCVRAGIHYDDIGRAQIDEILIACEALLLAMMEGEEAHDCEGLGCAGGQPHGGACGLPGQVDA